VNDVRDCSTARHAFLVPLLLLSALAGAPALVQAQRLERVAFAPVSPDRAPLREPDRPNVCRVVATSVGGTIGLAVGVLVFRATATDSYGDIIRLPLIIGWIGAAGMAAGYFLSEERCDGSRSIRTATARSPIGVPPAMSVAFPDVNRGEVRNRASSRGSEVRWPR
jgi:hypothetical protein